ncbi:MAG: 30S ribosomal protein S8e [Thermoproteota archaeon]|nr:30S ribosomal protein S8e [Thermoproteota archaeon]
MSVWHGNLHKRKPSGGKKRPHRTKRRFETGSFPTETMLGEPKRKVNRRRGGNVKVRVRREQYACVSNPKTGKTKRVEILRVMKNPASVDYNRRGVITKGALIETKLGTARVTSRPGQNGVINAVLTPE